MSQGTDKLEEQLSPRAGCWILAAPVVMAAVIVVGYGSLLLAGAIGRPASGEVVVLDFVGCAEAQPFVEGRVTEIGLGEPTFTTLEGGFSLRAQLPGDERADAELPSTLVQPGRLEIRDAEAADAAVVLSDIHLESATFRLDLAATPSTGLQLDDDDASALLAHMKADSEGLVSIWIDGELAGKVRNHPPEAAGRLDLEPVGFDVRDQIRVAAARAVVLNNGPLPCPVTVTERSEP